MSQEILRLRYFDLRSFIFCEYVVYNIAHQSLDELDICYTLHILY